MGILARQLRFHVIRPVLRDIGIWSEAREELLLGTSAQESQMGSYLAQLNGPALSIYQIEPGTHHWLWQDFLARPRYDELRNKTKRYVVGWPSPSPEELVWNLATATITCAAKYLSVPKPLPEKKDGVVGLAKYYKRWYNTPSGKATEEEFVDNYHDLVGYWK